MKKRVYHSQPSDSKTSSLILAKPQGVHPLQTQPWEIILSLRGLGQILLLATPAQAHGSHLGKLHGVQRGQNLDNWLVELSLEAQVDQIGTEPLAEDSNCPTCAPEEDSPQSCQCLRGEKRSSFTTCQRWRRKVGPPTSISGRVREAWMEKGDPHFL